MNTKIVPLLDYILILPTRIEEQSKTPSGIVLPTPQHKNSNQGTVLEVGEMVGRIKKGSKVIFRNFSFEIVETDDAKLLLIKEKDIMALVSD